MGNWREDHCLLDHVAKGCFIDLVSEWCQSIEISGVGSYILMEKIKALKVRLRRWNKEVFGRVEERKKDSLKKMAHWDKIES